MNLDWIKQNELLVRIGHRVGGLLALGIAALFALWLVNAFSSRVVARYAGAEATAPTLEELERRRRVETVVRVGSDVVHVFVYGFVVLSGLSQFGVSVQPLVAGAGLIGAAVAFGSQAIIKDYAAGFFILLENHFGLGDTIAVGTTGGTVEKMTLRVTVLRDVDGAIHIIPNGTIAVVTNRSNRWSNARVSLTLDPNADPRSVRVALKTAAEELFDSETHRSLWTDTLIVTGPIAMKEAGMEWSLAAKVPVGKASEAQPLMLEAAQAGLIAAGIKITMKG